MRLLRLNSLICLLALAASIFWLATPAVAQFWNGSIDTDWHTGANWDGGAVPTFGNNAVVASNVNSGTIVDITAANADTDGMFVGLEVNGTVVDGTVNHSAFLGTYTNGMVIGRGGATGNYNQTGDSSVITGFVAIGTADAGAVTPAGTGNYNLGDTATLTANSFLMMGEFPNSVGTMTLSGNSTVNATIGANPSVIVGRQGSTGTLNIHDSATLNATDRIHVGDFEGAKGTINQDGGTVNSAVTWLGVFDAGGQGTEGTYNLSGSAIHNTNQVIVGRDGGKGTLNVADSALVDINDALIIGDFNGGNGAVNQSGGTVDVGQWVGVGNAAGTTGAYNLTGGTLNIGTRATDDLKVGDAGVGTFTQSGASTVNIHRDLVVSAQGSAAGSAYTQDGGDVNVGITGGWMIIGRDGGSNGTYNLNGGNINATGRLVIGANGGSDGSMAIGPNAGTVGTGDSLIVGREGNGSLDQLGGTINTQYVDIGGDAGNNNVAATSRYTLAGGTLNATNDVRTGLNPNPGTPFVSGFNVVGTSVVNVDGSLIVSIDGNGHFLSLGSAASLNFGGNLDANSANVAQLIWGTDANGVNPLHIGGDVDVTGAELLLQLVDGDPGTGLTTIAQTTPSDLLLIDNQGANAVTGLLSFNSLTSPLQPLNEGDLLVDGALGLLDGLQYRITYLGGDGNDVVLNLVPEPTTLALVGLGTLVMAVTRRRKSGRM